MRLRRGVGRKGREWHPNGRLCRPTDRAQGCGHDERAGQRNGMTTPSTARPNNCWALAPFDRTSQRSRPPSRSPIQQRSHWLYTLSRSAEAGRGAGEPTERIARPDCSGNHSHRRHTALHHQRRLKPLDYGSTHLAGMAFAAGQHEPTNPAHVAACSVRKRWCLSRNHQRTSSIRLAGHGSATAPDTPPDSRSYPICPHLQGVACESDRTTPSDISGNGL